ncbi:hypothetical protein XAP412_530076 [Xanthomonas phaseoli pv. phaseoli]|uniref:Uncharacterized protein n=1 Tax=Xanthomonas campestris pv. phaseoli TaxID=317013 RepID=A0AB38E2D4_XANCH|nr:hypothetical protein XAP6984_580077 [Xanthomonas phaseoli pv. phaseoli]SON87467.1 hypothetical protein XAP412_530076 [Xanthomonas phaseoli pv. phaseoli]SON91266.1 hypothetical protein XAP7430_540078 [Xanthomonas phaseoli pv. phaseoli]
MDAAEHAVFLAPLERCVPWMSGLLMREVRYRSYVLDPMRSASETTGVEKSARLGGSDVTVAAT